MNFWWVNQKQTFRHEVGGGYLWSPKVQRNGARHFSYEYMKRLSPGDVVFSYAHAAICAIGVAQTHCYSFPKPNEFGDVGANWLDEGWKVDVKFRRLEEPIRTIDHIENLRRFLPLSKSPIKSADGGGNQAYLFLINKPFAVALAHLIDHACVQLVSHDRVADRDESFGFMDSRIDNWEDQIQEQISMSGSLSVTEKDQLVKSRRGQGKFRAMLLSKERRCRVTGVDREEHLIASHIKPWRSCDDRERLDPENGFMLSPSIDHLFDKGFISFEKNGSVVLADVADRNSMEKFGVIGEKAPASIGYLSEGQSKYLDWHRESILLL